MTTELLRLDSDIRNWVLIPITVAMFLVGVLRHNFARLLRGEANVDMKALREAQAVIRAERVRNNAGYIQSLGFRQRRVFFCHKETGVFSQKSKKLNPQQQMMSDPNMMTDMLKKNLNMIVPQMLTAAWVNFFLHRVRRREGAVPADPALPQHAPARHRAPVPRRHLRLQPLMVLPQLLRAPRRLSTLPRGQHHRRRAADAATDGDGDGHKQGVRGGQGKLGDAQARVDDAHC